MTDAPSTHHAHEDDKGLYVPVVNANYQEKGSPDVLEGFVPDHPSDDKTLKGIRSHLYAQGHEDGGPDKPDVPEYVPNSDAPEEGEEPVPPLSVPVNESSDTEGQDVKTTPKKEGTRIGK